MYTLGISNFPIPGEPGFPLNAMYIKPANKLEEGKCHPPQTRLCGYLCRFTMDTKNKVIISGTGLLLTFILEVNN